MSVNGRLPATICGNHLLEKKNVWTLMQDAFVNLITLLVYMSYNDS